MSEVPNTSKSSVASATKRNPFVKKALLNPKQSLSREPSMNVAASDENQNLNTIQINTARESLSNLSAADIALRKRNATMREEIEETQLAEDFFQQANLDDEIQANSLEELIKDIPKVRRKINHDKSTTNNNTTTTTDGNISEDMWEIEDNDLESIHHLETTLYIVKRNEYKNKLYDDWLDRWREQSIELRTKYHMAIYQNNINDLNHIESMYKNCVLCQDGTQNTVFHSAALAPDLNIFQKLGHALDISDLGTKLWTIKLEGISNEPHTIHYLYQALKKQNKNKSTATTTTTIIPAMNNVPFAKQSSTMLPSGNTGNTTDNITNIVAPIQRHDHIYPIILSGWLSKHREGNLWKKRWCTLTEKFLTYYASKNDSEPKGVIILDDIQINHILSGNNANISTTNTVGNTKKKSENITSIEIINMNLEEKSKTSFLFFNKKKNPKMFFQAETEIECQRWLYYLRALSNTITPIPYFDIRRYCNKEVRTLMLDTLNEADETPLHILARMSHNIQETATDIDKIKVLSSVFWLLYYGCDAYHMNGEEQTASDVAYSKDNSELSIWIQQVIPVTIDALNDPDSDQPSTARPQATPRPTRSGSISQMISAITINNNTNTTMEGYDMSVYNVDNVGLMACIPVPGYSYLSLLFQDVQYDTDKASISSEVNFQLFENISLHIALYGPNQHLLEPIQIVDSPIFRRKKFLYWAKSSQFQIPIENLMDNSTIEFILKCSPYGQDALIYEVKGSYILELTKLTSMETAVTFQDPMESMSPMSSTTTESLTRMSTGILSPSLSILSPSQGSTSMTSPDIKRSSLLVESLTNLVMKFSTSLSKMHY